MSCSLEEFKQETIIPLLKAIGEATAAEADNTYPIHSVEQVLSSFFVQHFNTREDIWQLLNALDEDIVDKAAIEKENRDDFILDILSKDVDAKGYFVDYFDKLEQKEDPYDLDEVFALATSSIWSSPTPYRQGERLISNGNATPYDRAIGLSTGGPFADCAETSLRHIAQLLHFDSNTRSFDLSHLKTPQVVAHSYFKNYDDFFARLQVSSANAGDEGTRTKWANVVGDLNRGTAPIEDEAQKILYVKNNNEIGSGFINILKVFNRIISSEGLALPQAGISLDDKRQWLEESFDKLFTKMNPTKTYKFDTSDITPSADKSELEGNLVIRVSDAGKELYSYKVFAKKGVHCEVGNLNYKQKTLDFAAALEDHEAQILPNSSQEVLWLLAARAQLMEKVKHPLHQLFKAYLSDNGARIGFLKMLLANLRKGGDPWLDIKGSDEMLNTILANVLEDISWGDFFVVDDVSPVVQELFKTPQLQQTLKNKVLGIRAMVKTENELHEIVESFSKLKYLYLSGSSLTGAHLGNLLSTLAELTALDLNNIESLVELSVAGFKKLQKLQLSGSSIVKIEGLNDLEELTFLDLSGTEHLAELSVAGLKKLQQLNLNVSSISKIDGLEDLTELTSLSLSDTESLAELSVVGLKKLQELYLNRSLLSRIDGLNDLENLTILGLSETKYAEISVAGLKKLRKLYLKGSSVTRIDGLNDLQELTKLVLKDTKHLAELSVARLKKLQELNLNGSSLSRIDGLNDLEDLTILDLSDTKSLAEISVAGLKMLQELNLSGSSLSRIDGLNDLEKLTKLVLSDTKHLAEISVAGLKKLPRLNLNGSLVSRIDGLNDLQELTFLSLKDTKHLAELSVAGLKKLQELNLGGSSVTRIDGINDLSELTKLVLNDTKYLRELSVAGLKKLQELNLGGSSVTRIDGLNDLSELTKLVLNDTKHLAEISVAGLKTLPELDLSGSSVTRIDGLNDLSELTKLVLNDTKYLRELSVAGLKKLQELNLNGSSVSRIDGLNDLEDLTILDLNNTEYLRELSVAGLKKLHRLNLNGSLVSRIDGLNDLQELTFLSLKDTKNLTELSVAGLEKLKILFLKGSSVNSDDLSRLKTSNPKLRITK